MAYQVMRTSKAKGKSGISAIQKHNQATKEVVEAIRENEIKSFGTSEIRMENHHLNKTLVECENFNEEVERVISERLPNKKIRKDAVKLLDGVVSLSPEAIPNLMCYLHRNDKEWQEKNKEMWEEHKDYTKEEIKQEYAKVMDYFKKSIDFYNAHYGQVISAEVHFHETTPHLHINTIPLVKGNEGEWKLSAKDIMGNKSKLSQMQTMFNEEVAKDYGLERGRIKNPKEAKKHFSKEEKKVQEIQAKYDEISNAYTNLQARFNNLKSDYNELQKQYNEILQTYIDLSERISGVSSTLQAIQTQLTTEQRRTLVEHTKKANEGIDKISQMMKEGKMPNIIFGQIAQVTHEVKQVEDFLEEEGFER